MQETAEKYWETRGAKDIKSDNYTPSWFHKIDKAPWENDGNSQGADKVVTIYSSRVSRPKNPTRVYKSKIMNTGTAPITINITLYPGQSSSEAYTLASTVYDCTTWADYYDASVYDYYGYRYSRHSAENETKTVLVQTGSTAMQNFAFEMEEDI